MVSAAKADRTPPAHMTSTWADLSGIRPSIEDSRLPRGRWTEPARAPCSYSSGSRTSRRIVPGRASSASASSVVISRMAALAAASISLKVGTAVSFPDVSAGWRPGTGAHPPRARLYDGLNATREVNIPSPDACRSVPHRRGLRRRDVRRAAGWSPDRSTGTRRQDRGSGGGGQLRRVQEGRRRPAGPRCRAGRRPPPSRSVRAGRFHFVSISFRMDVWSWTTWDT